MTQRKDDRLWGGRFERKPDKEFDAFQRSFAFDRRLLPYEIAVDRVWAKTLEPIGIFTATEVAQTLAALDNIAKRVKTDPDWVEKPAGDFLRMWLNFTHDAAVENAPEWSGDLKRSIEGARDTRRFPLWHDPRRPRRPRLGGRAKPGGRIHSSARAKAFLPS